MPYTHSCLHPLCDDKRLRGCFDELKNSLSTTFKETDLFKARFVALSPFRPPPALANHSFRMTHPQLESWV